MRYCIDFMWKLHVHLRLRVLLSLSMLSPEKLFFSRRAVFASFVLPGRGRAKQLMVLILEVETVEEEKSGGEGLLLSSPCIPPTL